VPHPPLGILGASCLSLLLPCIEALFPLFPVSVRRGVALALVRQAFFLLGLLLGFGGMGAVEKRREVEVRGRADGKVGAPAW